MGSVDDVSWSEQAHARGVALEYALMLLRLKVLTKDNYLQEAAKFWHFMRDGSVMVAEFHVPDDLSGWAADDLPDWDEGGRDAEDMVPHIVMIPDVDTERLLTAADLADIPLPPEPAPELW